jgi:hypothetical protein
VDEVNTSVIRHSSEDVVGRPDHIALGLLRLQQRLDALDRLYNEEITNLSRELAELKADYVRQFQARPTPSRAGRAAKSQTQRTSRG